MNSETLTSFVSSHIGGITELAGLIVGIIYLYWEYKGDRRLWIAAIIMPAISLHVYYSSALLLIGYGVFLSGFTGGAVAGGGIVIYVLSRKVRGLPIVVLDGVGAISGISWCLWIIGFLFFFILPQYWLLSLFLAALGLLLKVASKIGLIGIMMREEYGRK